VSLKALPLIRIKVEYTGFDLIRVKQLESKFLGRVANEGDIFKFWRKVNNKKTDAVKNNEKLRERFDECLKEKISFETLTSDSSSVIAGIFEDMMNNHKKKPSLLFNYSAFTQKSGQKFTPQAVSNYITDSVNYASTKLAYAKTNEFKV